MANDTLPKIQFGEVNMPGSQEVTINGLGIKRVKPNYWKRRLTKFPFFFENHNTTFSMESTAMPNIVDYIRM